MRTRRGAAVAAAIAAIAVVVAGYGYAASSDTNQAYTGCLVSGSITNVAIGSAPAKPCQKSSQQISWSQTGPAGTAGTNGTNGTDGVSVTSATEPAGANCAAGGSKFVAASNNVTYACNGANGANGDPGPANLAALQGSPCTVDGKASTLQVSVEPSTGAVNMTCTPPLPPVEASVTVTGGSLFRISILDFAAGGGLHNSATCDKPNATSCSLDVVQGHDVQVQLTDTRPFNYTCPGAQTTAAVESGGSFSGTCQTSSVTASYAVTATITS